MLKQRTFFLKTSIYFFISQLVFIDVLRNSLLQYSYPDCVLGLKVLAIIIRIFVACVAGYYLLRSRSDFMCLVEKIIYILLLFVTMLFQKNFVYFDMFFISIFLAKFLDYKTVANTYLYSLIFSVVVVVIMQYIKIFPVYMVIREETERVRTSLGFTHPNTLGHTLLYICMLYLIVHEHNIKYYDLILVGVVSLWLYIYPNSITSSLLLVLLAIFIIAMKMGRFLLKKDILKLQFVRILSLILIPVLLFGLYMIIIQGRGREIVSNISSTLTTRIIMSQKGIELYGFQIFNSQNIEFTGTAAKYFGESSGYFVVDCLYVYIFLVFGIIPGIFYFLYYIKCVRNSFSKSCILWIVLILLMLFSITEASMITFKSSFIFILPMCKYCSETKNRFRDTI